MLYIHATDGCMEDIYSLQSYIVKMSGLGKEKKKYYEKQNKKNPQTAWMRPQVRRRTQRDMTRV